MSDSVLSFRVRVDHGCLLVRDMQGDDDVSDWDPGSSNWYKSGSSVIFGVLPASEGWIECEVWKSRPHHLLPIRLFAEKIESPSGWLVIHDPNEHVRMAFRGSLGSTRVSALVDNRDFASKVQIVIGDDIE
ncbi:hypothetical protein ACFWNL_35795 [Kitasatospora sp. NPDC058397]|uniref:hypothetical protein n=1 Tax=unclassified Kitasatospora TaxID=2633591 RepID=UPI0036599F5D